MWEFFQTAAKKLNNESSLQMNKEDLLLEQDYELASLAQAMKQQDVNEINRSKKRLAEIHQQLKSMH
ncbi:hypothetical protein AEA09_08175 [Lysinibacillus contaminans]|uniref:Spore protein n=1 Tax=Lysinibacillus contaminans TaxID=1293441 RepID=A0ABR5K1C9_9BACI|nr:hypothetical protein [Lysinibacillus contaminans]KOS68529.1 hypothetical protein AEA09_08175 [Lysinibacillus contaminans]